jgi:integrase
MRKTIGHLYQRNGTGKYRLRFMVDGKVTDISTGTTKKREAEAFRLDRLAAFTLQGKSEQLQAVAAQLADTETKLARIHAEENPPLLIRDAWRTFENSLTRPDSGPGTLENYANHWKLFSKWLAANHPDAVYVRDVTAEVAAAYAGYLLRERKVTANTFNKHVRLLDLVFRVVSKEARLVANPWARDVITRKTVVSNSRRELTVDELWKVCTDATGELRLLLAIGIYTGLRRGDCATLRWGEVDLIRQRIVRVPSKTGRRHPVPVTISIHPTLLAMLAIVPAEGRGEYVLPETAEKYRKNQRELTRDIQDHFKSCGILLHQPGTGMKRIQKTVKGKTSYESAGNRAVVEVGFHSLRHTFVSLCREGNVPLAVVEKLVGHSNPAMTRHYTHVSEQAQQDAMRCLPDVMAADPMQTPAPVPANDASAILERIRALVEGMNGRNWRTVKAEILEGVAI